MSSFVTPRLCVKPASTPRNPTGAENLLCALWNAEDAAKAVREDHGPDCDCPVCDHVQGMAYTLTLYAAAIEGDLIPFPAMIRRLTSQGDRPSFAG
jgi:hypothetical protein